MSAETTEAAWASKPPPAFFDAIKGRNPDFGKAGAVMKQVLADAGEAPAEASAPAVTPAAESRSLPPYDPGPYEEEDMRRMPYYTAGVRAIADADKQFSMIHVPKNPGLLDLKPAHPAFYGRYPNLVPTPKFQRLARHGVPYVLLPCDVPGYVLDERMLYSPVAHPGLRLWVELMLYIKPQVKQRAQRWEIWLSTQQVSDWLWPNVRARSGKYRRLVRQALHFVHNSVVPLQHGHQGTPGYWLPFAVRQWTKFDEPDSSIMIEALVAPESPQIDAGPLVYKSSLREWGHRSATAWRLTLALAWLWNKYLTGDGGARFGAQEQFLPDLGREELIWLATPKQHRGLRKKKKQARHDMWKRTERALKLMQQRGDVRIWEMSGDRYMLLTPEWWNDERPGV